MRDPVAKLTELGEKSKIRNANKNSAKAESVVVAGQETEAKQNPACVRRRGQASRNVLADAQLSLFGLIKERDLGHAPIKPQSEYPTLLSRIPVFIPGHKKSQKVLLDEDNALPFYCSWGKGRRHGPLLTIYDEDVFIAMCKLRQTRVSGKPGRLPYGLNTLNTLTDESGKTEVHIAQFMLSDLHKILGTSSGGNNNRRLMQSIKNLAGTTIEFETASSPDSFITKGTSIKLVDVIWDYYGSDGIIQAQVHPVVAHWFDNAYTYLDWKLRRKLTDSGKAHHRFFSTQPKKYKIQALTVMKTIGYSRDYKKYMSDLRQDLNTLQEMGWIQDYKISGNGRSVPHMIEIMRS